MNFAYTEIDTLNTSPDQKMIEIDIDSEVDS